MDIAKQYITQCIVTAANNLRLSSEKIEIVAILREHLSNCENLSEEVKNMKKITQLSKFAIKLGEICNYIENSKIDFLKISDRFRDHSHNILRELNHVLDVNTPQSIREALYRDKEETINVDLSNRESKAAKLNTDKIVESDNRIKGYDEEESLKERFILDDIRKEKEFDFEDYEDIVLKPIKKLDNFLTRMENNNYNRDEIEEFIPQIKKNTELSGKIGFEIITNMHQTFLEALNLLHSGKIIPTKDIIEGMRANLIVIVAVVRGKEVDITNYLNKAERFSRNILAKKREV